MQKNIRQYASNTNSLKHLEQQNLNAKDSQVSGTSKPLSLKSNSRVAKIQQQALKQPSQHVMKQNKIMQEYVVSVLKTPKENITMQQHDTDRATDKAVDKDESDDGSSQSGDDRDQNDQSGDVQSGDIPEEPNDLRFLLPSLSCFSINAGIEFELTWLSPRAVNDCFNNALCKLIVQKLPASVITLAGSFSDGVIQISASLTGTIEVAEYLTLEKASIEIKSGVEGYTKLSCMMVYKNPSFNPDALRFQG